jgi:hypothetical protein
MKKENKWIWILVPALIIAGCSLSSVADKKDPTTPNPSAGGTGSVAVNSGVAGVTFVNSLLSGITTASKPSAGLNAGIVASAFTLPPSHNCSGGGVVNFTGLTSGTAVNCIENGGTITANTTITIIPLSLTTCGTPAKDVPAGLLVTLNGPIKIGSADFTLTDFSLAFNSVTYDSACKPASFVVSLTGAIADSAIDTSVDYGSVGVVFNVIINRSVTPNQAEITIPASGSVTVHTPCLDGSFTMSTTSDIIIPDGATCPTSGSVTVSGGLNGVVTYPIDCTNPACAV